MYARFCIPLVHLNAAVGLAGVTPMRAYMLAKHMHPDCTHAGAAAGLAGAVGQLCMGTPQPAGTEDGGVVMSFILLSMYMHG